MQKICINNFFNILQYKIQFFAKSAKFFLISINLPTSTTHFDLHCYVWLCVWLYFTVFSTCKRLQSTTTLTLSYLTVASDCFLWYLKWMPVFCYLPTFASDFLISADIYLFMLIHLYFHVFSCMYFVSLFSNTGVYLFSIIVCNCNTRLLDNCNIDRASCRSAISRRKNFNFIRTG